MSVIPVVRELAIDHVDTVRETLASQLDKIVLYFLHVCVLSGRQTQDTIIFKRSNE